MDLQPALAGPSQNNGPTFASLPAEIIHNILDFIVPQRPSIGETRPVAYNSIAPGDDWHAFTRGRRGLWSLCLVSRHFASLAQKLLYKTVAILDEDSFVLFFRTAFETGLPSSLTRSFSCHLTLTRPNGIRSALGARVPAEIAIHFYRARKGGCDRTPEAIMLFLLIRLVRMETLLINLPICDDYPDYTTLLSDLIAFRTRHFPKVKGEWNQWMVMALDIGNEYDVGGENDPAGERLLQSLEACFPIAPEAPFMHLETLMLQGDPELRQYFEEDDGDGTHRAPETWGAQAWRYTPLYIIFPKLTTLEVSTDDGTWDLSCLIDTGSEYHLKNIRHVYLHDSIACPRNLHRILEACPNLETLYMTPRIDEGLDYNFMDDPGESTDAHPESLNTALIKYGKKLRHLDVGWFEVLNANFIGPEGRLPVLPKLTRLEKICVPLAVLYGSDVALVPLAGLLPPNIVDLTLEDWWWTDIDDYDEMHDWGPMDRLEHYRAKRDYRTNALNSLIQFAGDSVSQPRLKTVLLLCHIPATWVVQDGDPLDFHFAEVKRAFRLRGVEFLVDEA